MKQGCALLPVLFTVYIHGSLQQLQSSGVGCHIGGVFAGAFGYADDIVLLSLSVDALRHMICFCEDYAEIITLSLILQSVNYYIKCI